MAHLSIDNIFFVTTCIYAHVFVRVLWLLDTVGFYKVYKVYHRTMLKKI